MGNSEDRGPLDRAETRLSRFVLGLYRILSLVVVSGSWMRNSKDQTRLSRFVLGLYRISSLVTVSGS